MKDNYGGVGVPSSSKGSTLIETPFMSSLKSVSGVNPTPTLRTVSAVTSSGVLTALTLALG
ncbi:MAG: hypothetical protein M0P32_08160 [Bacteroidales bacterium]|nr:hypothetical protein [Bacteroidales bacterium]MDD4703711.1 hypothetical protein [Bacteroidales bacterium]